MKFTFAPHFRERMIERGIDFDHVKSAIKDPDVDIGVFQGRIRVTKKVGEKTIEVVYYRNEFGNKKKEYIVITAYYL
jgi:hypothetical protein